MTLTVTLDLPENLVQELENDAQKRHRSIADVLSELVVQNWQSVPKLPDNVEMELGAMSSLSDEALWLLARSTMSKDEQEQLAMLNQQAKERTLARKEEELLEKLLHQYDRTMIRRAQAASLLQKRGYDTGNPKVLQPQ
ncbi:MAG: hypothetical protein KDE54_25285 [Caldilineaceae bacterium]|nr:hypothetical protein [Caldilineaceae bacterium]MCB0091241.1 hypothetical protein [Caldilineaceae bacterium]MCB0097104.1 hypothetical protein [Caldilineaceae bacterium]MCB9150444.1 hypothetical protein [Caldilineaceae bacterium]